MRWKVEEENSGGMGLAGSIVDGILLRSFVADSERSRVGERPASEGGPYNGKKNPREKTQEAGLKANAT
jgi:hypothetical protein